MWCENHLHSNIHQRPTAMQNINLPSLLLKLSRLTSPLNRWGPYRNIMDLSQFILGSLNRFKKDEHLLHTLIPQHYSNHKLHMRVITSLTFKLKLEQWVEWERVKIKIKTKNNQIQRTTTIQKQSGASEWPQIIVGLFSLMYSVRNCNLVPNHSHTKR